MRYKKCMDLFSRGLIGETVEEALRWLGAEFSVARNQRRRVHFNTRKSLRHDNIPLLERLAHIKTTRVS